MKKTVSIFFAIIISLLFASHVSASLNSKQQDDTSKISSKKTSTIALPSKTKNAWEIPAFKLKGLDGKIHSLDQWKGKVILLNFWASWCAPCQQEIKDFVVYQEQLSSKNLQIVSIGVDNERKLKNVSRTLEINYPVLLAPLEKQTTGKQEGLSGRDILTQWGNLEGFIPYSVIIKADGNIHYIHRGQLDADSFNIYVLPLLQP